MEANGVPLLVSVFADLRVSFPFSVMHPEAPSKPSMSPIEAHPASRDDDRDSQEDGDRVIPQFPPFRRDL